MIAEDRSLTAYVERFLMTRDVSSEYAYLIRMRARQFGQWLGHEPKIADLSCELLNEWLAAIKDEGDRSPHTIDSYRRCLLAIWNDAYLDGWNDNPSLRLRKIRKPRLIVKAYTHAEIRALLVAAAKLLGRHPDGSQRSDWWQAAIHLGYSIGARRGDLWRIKRADVAPDGRLMLMQSKTQSPVSVKISAAALEFLGKLRPPNGRLLHWPYHKDTFTRHFQQLRGSAGVTRGSFKWLRRSAGSYAERDNQGNGSRLLGHRSPQIFAAHYEDQTISRPHVVEPPAILD